MASAQGNQTKAGNISALERATGRSWADWLDLFDSAGAAKLPHADIARVAREAMPDSLENPDWWAQGAAIAFEQHAGLRVPGQSSAGDFRVSASRTVTFGRDEAIERWTARFGEQSHRDRGVSSARTSRTEKRSFWRAALEQAGKVEVSAEQKGDGRAIVVINHTGLEGPGEIEAWRAHWKACLGEF